jgi:DNA (cytosine-5)-methyltransferase 1
MKTPSKLKVIELFAGVGGFRIGLEGWKGKSSTSNFKKKISNKIPFEITYSNQWEPKTKRQQANEVYLNRFGSKGHFDISIDDISVKDLLIKCDLMVGGFPCQDYSVATTLHNSKGLKGKKGVLWWSIHKILEDKKNKLQLYELSTPN